MSGDRPSQREAKLERAIADIIGNTRRVRRERDLVQVADRIRDAWKGLGSLAAVAETVGLSEQTLRDFLSVSKVVPEVRRLVQERRIDAVDLVVRISRMPEADQHALALAFMAGRIDLRDARAVLNLVKMSPNTDVQTAIRRIETSRNVREHVVEFVAPPGARPHRVKARLGEIVGEENVRSLTIHGQIGTAVVTTPGLRRLTAAAKARGVTRRKMVEDAAQETVTPPGR